MSSLTQQYGHEKLTVLDTATATQYTRKVLANKMQIMILVYVIYFLVSVTCFKIPKYFGDTR